MKVKILMYIFLSIVIFLFFIGNCVAVSPSDIRFGSLSIPFDIEAGHNITLPMGNNITAPWDRSGSPTNYDDNYKEFNISDTIEDGLKLCNTTYNSIYVGINGYITFGHSRHGVKTPSEFTTPF